MPISPLPHTFQIVLNCPRSITYFFLPPNESHEFLLKYVYISLDLISQLVKFTIIIQTEKTI